MWGGAPCIPTVTHHGTLPSRTPYVIYIYLCIYIYIYIYISHSTLYLSFSLVALTFLSTSLLFPSPSLFSTFLLSSFLLNSNPPLPSNLPPSLSSLSQFHDGNLRQTEPCDGAVVALSDIAHYWRNFVFYREKPWLI